MNSEKTITITANGDSFTVPPGQLLEAFLTKLGFPAGMVVVERNQEAVSPSETGEVALAEGDTLEIVRIVAGG